VAKKFLDKTKTTKYNIFKMKKTYLVILFLLFFVPPVSSEPYASTKMGYVKMRNDNIDIGLLTEGALGYRFKHTSLEASLGYWQANIKGVDADVSDHKNIGKMTFIPLLLTGKIHVKNFYLGGGIGKAFMDFEENYFGQAEVKSSNVFHALVGFSKGNWAFEIRKTFGDIKVESGHPVIGILEDDSRFESLQFSIGYKW